jgi:NDP-sugar pyrophosphorylase family protein
VRGMTVDQRLTLTTPADLLAINLHYLARSSNQRQLAPLSVGANTSLVAPLRIERGTVVGARCTLGPNVYVEHSCQIGDGATIKNAVILREAVVPPGASIEDQVVI